MTMAAVLPRVNQHRHRPPPAEKRRKRPSFSYSTSPLDGVTFQDHAPAPIHKPEHGGLSCIVENLWKTATNKDFALLRR